MPASAWPAAGSDRRATAFERARLAASPACKVYDDIDIARAGAHGGEDGAVIIVGTGSAAMAMVDGQRHQCGGWGFHIGDQMTRRHPGPRAGAAYRRSRRMGWSPARR